MCKNLLSLLYLPCLEVISFIEEPFYIFLTKLTWRFMNFVERLQYQENQQNISETSAK